MYYVDTSAVVEWKGTTAPMGTIMYLESYITIFLSSFRNMAASTEILTSPYIHTTCDPYLNPPSTPSFGATYIALIRSTCLAMIPSSSPFSGDLLISDRSRSTICIASLKTFYESSRKFLPASRYKYESFEWPLVAAPVFWYYLGLCPVDIGEKMPACRTVRIKF